jgi:hypothetical protein
LRKPESSRPPQETKSTVLMKQLSKGSPLERNKWRSSARQSAFQGCCLQRFYGLAQRPHYFTGANLLTLFLYSALAFSFSYLEPDSGARPLQQQHRCDERC